MLYWCPILYRRALSSLLWIELERDTFPKELWPDATFRYDFNAAQVLGRWLEVDRGTERGVKKWQEKATAYLSVFGKKRERVLILTPSLTRTLAIKTILADTRSDRFWITDCTILDSPDLSLPVWHTPGEMEPKPLLLLSLASAPSGV